MNVITVEDRLSAGSLTVQGSWVHTIREKWELVLDEKP